MDDAGREHVLGELQEWLEKPMIVLSLVWLVLLVVELAWGLNRALWILGQAIWVLFLAEFALSLGLAPDRVRYLRDNWLKLLALAAPALRVLRIARLARFARASRGLRLLRVVSSVNRAMRALGGAMRRRGFGYVLLLTLVVAFAGAAGMYAFEREAPGGGFDSFSTALWWTAMLLTSMGSEYWPKTGDGRVLCLVLAVYGFAVFGYVTATLATYFIGRDAEDSAAEVAGARDIAVLRQELAALRAALQSAQSGST